MGVEVDEDRVERARLGILVRQRRVTLGYSQPALAEASSISVSTISRLERGEATSLRPASETRLEEALGWERGSMDSIRAGHRPDELAFSRSELLPRIQSIFRDRLMSLVAEAPDDRTARLAMRAAEAAARAVIDTANEVGF